MGDNPRTFVILIHRAAGNAEVGESWIETHVLPGDTTLQEVGEIVAKSQHHGSVSLNDVAQFRCTASLQLAEGPGYSIEKEKVEF